MNNTYLLELTKEEREAIHALEQLAKTWPKTIWLFAGNGLNVMKGDENGNRILTASGGVDNNYVIKSINIPSDGGDF